MKASIIICTHNRENYIDKSLQSALNQTFKDKFEVIVVDNASTDGTRKIARNTIDQNNGRVPAKIVEEKKLGLSCARNCGSRHASGEIVAYLDDDAIAAADWLEKLVAVFDQNPRAGVVGGRIHPIWVEPRPEWLIDDFVTLYTILDFGESTHEIKENQWLAGANISYRHSLLDKFDGFSEDLGRKGNLLLSHEETHLNQKISDDGYQLIYNGKAVVHHHILPDRMNPKWLLQRLYWQGISEAILKRSSSSDQKWRSYLNPIGYAKAFDGALHYLRAQRVLNAFQNDGSCAKDLHRTFYGAFDAGKKLATMPSILWMMNGP